MKKYTYLVNFDSQTLERVGESFAVKGDGGIAELEFAIPSNFGIPANQALWRVFFKLPGERESLFETLPAVAATESGDYVTSWTISKAITQKAGRLAFSLAAISGNDIQWDSQTVIMQVSESQYQPESEEAEKPYTGRLDALEGTMAAIRGEFAEVQDDFEELKETATLGTPIPESLVANMQEGHVYIYTGTEPGYTAGHVYYYVGGTLTDGGVYGGTAVDATLTQSGKAADAAAVGAEVSAIKEDLSVIQPELDAIHDSVEQLPIGLPEAQKTLIISIMRNALYSMDMSADIDALEDAFFANIPATAVTLNKTSVSLEGTESQVALVATVIPLNSTDVVVWTSSNPTIATVDSNGLVTAVGTGTCTITATAGSVSATCSVTVSMVSIVSIDVVYTQSGTVYTTDSLDSLKDDLVVTAHWSNGTTTTVDSYDYTLSGTLTAGASTITATYAGCTDTFTITVTQKDLDSIAYENKSYRDIFMTGNLLSGTDFENGIPTGWTVNAGSPEITTEDYVSASHSVKYAGTTSAQYGIDSSAAAGFGRTAGKTYFQACKMNCTRYVAGYLGFSNIVGDFVGSISAVTDGWVTKYKYGAPSTSEEPSWGFVGSYGSANLDGYMDDLVNVCLSDLFETVPNSDTILALYEEYCTLRNGGAS